MSTLVFHELDDGNRTGRFVIWEDGDMTGDRNLIQTLENLSIDYEGVYLGVPESERVKSDHLENPVSVLTLASIAWEEDVEAVGTGLPNYDNPEGENG